MRALVVGGSGYLGQFVIQSMLDAGYAHVFYTYGNNISERHVCALFKQRGDDVSKRAQTFVDVLRFFQVITRGF